jgi:hypothetical protein
MILFLDLVNVSRDSLDGRVGSALFPRHYQTSAADFFQGESVAALAVCVGHAWTRSNEPMQQWTGCAVRCARNGSLTTPNRNASYSFTLLHLDEK